MHLITIVGLAWLGFALTFLTLLAWSYNAKLRELAAQVGAAEPHPRAGHDSGGGGDGSAGGDGFPAPQLDSG